MYENGQMTEICNFGLVMHAERDVVFEKTLKLYCQMIVLQIKVKGNVTDECPQLFAADGFKQIILSLTKNHLSKETPQGMDPEQYEALQTVILNNLALISAEELSSYHNIISQTFMDNFQSYSSEVQIQMLEGGLLCDIASVNWILQRIESEKGKTFDASEMELLMQPINKFKGSQVELEKAFEKYIDLENENSNKLLSMDSEMLKTLINKS